MAEEKSSFTDKFFKIFRYFISLTFFFIAALLLVEIALGHMYIQNGDFFGYLTLFGMVGVMIIGGIVFYIWTKREIKVQKKYSGLSEKELEERFEILAEKYKKIVDTPGHEKKDRIIYLSIIILVILAIFIYFSIDMEGGYWSPTDLSLYLGAIFFFFVCVILYLDFWGPEYDLKLEIMAVIRMQMKIEKGKKK